MKVSQEVVDAYTKSNTYSTVSKRDWKRMGKDGMSPKRSFPAVYTWLLIGGIIGFLSTMRVSPIEAPLIIGIPAGIIFIASILTILGVGISMLLTVFEDELILKETETNEEYRHLNHSYYVKLEGEEHSRYYSKWYLDLIGVEKVNTMYRFNFTNRHEEVTESLNHTSITPRPNDRFNWKNNLSTNRPLSFKEFKQLKKSETKFKEFMNLEEDIREFQDYHKLRAEEK